jgi:hypothetical protein
MMRLSRIWRIFAANGEDFMALTKEQIAAANARAAERSKKGPIATAAKYDRRIGRIVIDLSSGLAVSFRPQDAQGLGSATPANLAKIEITPSGLGIRFPELDADIYLPALLEGFLGSRRWMAAANGRIGGKASGDAKAAAAKANGKLGGRPRKVPLAA